ncbi:MAG: helicase HerA-like domain-containing protein [Candidatus Thorarchaeota archaeon]
MSDEFFLGRTEKGNFTMDPTTLVTHALVLGASGSGKTVMCKAIVEEALQQQVPVIAIDPKGDIAGLGMGFERLEHEIVAKLAETEANDRGKPVEEVASELIDLYGSNLQKFYGDTYEAALKSYANAVSVVIITPKEPAGVQISLVPNFDRPKDYKKLDQESITNLLDMKIQLLIQRCGYGAVTSTDNKVVFLSNIIQHVWKTEKSPKLDMEKLIALLLTPPVDKIGVIAVEKFFPKKAREDFANRLNALMIKEIGGIRLDIGWIIDYASQEGKTPLIIFDVRRITQDKEKSLFVAEVLGAIQRYIWDRGGTSRLRAILYFDELYGFLPPTSKPPSKTALMILLKQARAFGLGCLLATQNPGDLDYRAIGQVSTWFLGKLTSDRDIQKVEKSLKSIFESEGRSLEEFKQLMSRVRGLTPGNFVFYNPKEGIENIQARWLLSYHRGPLLPDEIREISLHPEEDESVEEPAAASKEAAEAAFIPGDLVLKEKKRKLGPEDRFVKAKIIIESEDIISRTKDRLSLYDNGVELSISSIQPYYSPVLDVSMKIAKKEKVTFRGKDVPIVMDDVAHRAYGLTKELDWSSIVFEGIHPPSLSPDELQLTPDDAIKLYADVPKEEVNRIISSIDWYFTQLPNPEAKQKFHDTLSDLKNREEERLTGDLDKQILRLEKKVSKSREQLTTAERRIQERQMKIKDLSKSFEERKKAGKATTQVEASLESNRSKLGDYEAKQQILKKELAETLEQIEDAQQQKEERFGAFRSELEELRNAGPPASLYRLTKKDIKIEEKAIYWIPKALVDFEIAKKDDEGGLIRKVQIDINLLNGNSIVECDVCGSAVLKKDPHFPEIAPPIFVCNVCLKFLCRDHAKICVSCGKMACVDHISVCKICDNAICADCAQLCATCGLEICPEHTKICSSCHNAFCTEEEFSICNICDQELCPDCSGDFLECSAEDCDKSGCEKHFISCGSCSEPFCTDGNHLQECRSCKKEVCLSCGKVTVMLAGKKQIAKCKSCS